ncbi:hypothetical protein CEXT_346121 [Caerostris extrusa]|uniref:Uncharacterized protein n=1 Tax=Caerostris extrusa TaxID=172846 RepID=A0AAV4TYN6_CAEEX|nr:hypothetical protein CEXT_346121 [Caerostris extrusa]
MAGAVTELNWLTTTKRKNVHGCKPVHVVNFLALSIQDSIPAFIQMLKCLPLDDWESILTQLYPILHPSTHPLHPFHRHQSLYQKNGF